MTERLKSIEKWLCEDLGYNGVSLSPASEDASFRQYFRASWGQETAIVMDAPPDKEDCKPFIEITGRLRECGVNAPGIRASNLQQGFLLLDDFGSELYLDVLTSENADRLYRDAVHAIVKFQGKGRTAGLPEYDSQLLIQEMELFRDWLVGRHLQIEITSSIDKIFNDVFLYLSESALEQPRVFVHRDYHSRNLMYLENNNPGILDYQDAVNGPVTYDLVSLFRDCYIKWPREKVLLWLKAYKDSYGHSWARSTSDEKFLRWFDLMGAQRHLKASGIFARLLYRDGKQGFMRNVPRTLTYILDLEGDYPGLSSLIGFIKDMVVPRLGPYQP